MIETLGLWMANIESFSSIHAHSTLYIEREKNDGLNIKLKKMGIDFSEFYGNAGVIFW